MTEYQRLRCQCPTCGTTHEGTFPSDVTAPTQDGPGVFALATLLNTGHLMPVKKILTLCADLFGVSISERTLVAANTASYERLAVSEAVIHAQLQRAPVCHVDETGIRVDGHLSWYHVATTPALTYAGVPPNRGDSR